MKILGCSCIISNRKLQQFIFLLNVFMVVTFIRTYNDLDLVKTELVDLGNGAENIFFIESSPDKTHLDSLAFCAMESAANKNREKNVLLFVTTANYHISQKNFPPYLKAIPNLDFRRLDIGQLIADFFPNITLEKQAQLNYRDVSLNELSRSVLLFQGGGTYMDQDTITIRGFPGDIVNFVPMEYFRRVNSAVMRFQKGHLLLGKALDRMPKRLTRDDWGNFGPKTFTDIMETNCLPKNLSADVNQFEFAYECDESWKVNIPSVNTNVFIQSSGRVRTLSFHLRHPDEFPSTLVVHLNDIDNRTAESLQTRYSVLSLMSQHCPDSYKALISQ